MAKPTIENYLSKNNKYYLFFKKFFCIFAESKQKRHTMQKEKASRIVSTSIAVAAFALCVARHLFFPETSCTVDIPIALLVVVSLWGIWRPSKIKKENSNE